MNPVGIKHVEITDHAWDAMEKHGVEADLIIGRIMHRHGFYYEDHEEGGYNFHLPDKDLVVAIEIQFSSRYNGKQAVVETVFPVSNPGKRFGKQRFTEWEG